MDLIRASPPSAPSLSACPQCPQAPFRRVRLPRGRLPLMYRLHLPCRWAGRRPARDKTMKDAWAGWGGSVRRRVRRCERDLRADSAGATVLILEVAASYSRAPSARSLPARRAPPSAELASLAASCLSSPFAPAPPPSAACGTPATQCARRRAHGAAGPQGRVGETQCDASPLSSFRSLLPPLALPVFSLPPTPCPSFASSPSDVHLGHPRDTPTLPRCSHPASHGAIREWADTGREARLGVILGGISVGKWHLCYG